MLQQFTPINFFDRVIFLQNLTIAFQKLKSWSSCTSIVYLYLRFFRKIWENSNLLCKFPPFISIKKLSGFPNKKFWYLNMFFLWVFVFKGKKQKFDDTLVYPQFDDLGWLHKTRLECRKQLRRITNFCSWKSGKKWRKKREKKSKYACRF